MSGTPTIVSFDRSDPAATNADTVHYTLTFSDAVSGIGMDSFALDAVGVIGASIVDVSEVAGSDGRSYVVTLSTGSGDGSIGLSFDPVGVVDSNGNPLPDGTFLPGTIYHAAWGGVPEVALADFNGDGKLDVAAMGYQSSTVSVFFGNGDGTLQSPSYYRAGWQSPDLAVGDFNGDGKPDIISGGLTSGSANVLLNNGDGTFATGQVIYTPGAADIAIGDLNGDGKSDLVIANEYNDMVSVFVGNGDGTFSAAGTYPAGETSNGVALGDFNGDGKLDMVVADQDAPQNHVADTLAVLLGNGDGTFQPATYLTVGNTPQYPMVADLNGDGKLDIVTNEARDNTISVLLGNGDGTFQDRVDYAAGPWPQRVVAADVNRDGVLDLVVSNVTGPAPSTDISVFFGRGDGTFEQQVRYPGSEYSQGLAIGDLNADGVLDTVVGSGGWSTDVTVMLGNPASGGAERYTIDRTAPDAAAIESVTDDVSSYTGALTAGARTNDNNLTVRVSISGTGALAGDTLRLYDGSGTANALGLAHVLTTAEIAAGWVDLQTGTVADGSHTITARITDAVGNESAVSTNDFAVTVDTTAPAISSNGGGATAAVTVTENTTHVTNILAGDPDAGDTPILSISGGEDAALFQLVGNALRFIAAPDYEDLPGQGLTPGYQVMVQAIDAAGNADTQTLTVSVSNVGGITLSGGNKDQTLTGGAEEDALTGGNGKDTLYGRGGNDTLLGGNGKDILYGQDGRDILNGGTGDDRLIGGAGIDTFIFNGQFGRDVVTDFAAGIDHIQLSHSQFADFAEVLSHAVQSGADTVITLDPFDTITLSNVSLASLHAGDFIFI